MMYLEVTLHEIKCWYNSETPSEIFLSWCPNYAGNFLNLFQLARKLSRNKINLFSIAPKTFYNCLLTACKVSSTYSFHSRLCNFLKLGGTRNQNLTLWNFESIQRSQISMLLLEIFTSQLEWHRQYSYKFSTWFDLKWLRNI